MIVVTGGAGFIGSAVIWALNKKGITDILAVDHLADSEKWKNLPNLNFLDYMERDEFLAQLLYDELPEIKGIIHLGAITSTTEKDFQKLITYNYEYTKQLALWCTENNRQLLYASSAATYGDGKHGFDDAQDSISHLKPLNPYGYSKQLFDLWAQKKGLSRQITGLKYFNVFGPNEYHKGDMRSIVHKAFEQIRQTGEMKLFKSHNPEYQDGGQLRDFVYIKDAVAITLYLFEKALPGIYNVGSGKARSFADLTDAVFKALNRESKITYIDMPHSIRDQYQYFTKAEMEKLAATGYDKPMTSLEDAVTDYVQNYLMASDPHLA